MLFIYSKSGIGELEKEAKYVQINKGDFRTTTECHSSGFTVNFEDISQLFLVFLLLTLNIHYVFF